LSLALFQSVGSLERDFTLATTTGLNPIRLRDGGNLRNGSRSALASQRAAIAREQLAQCHWCAHRCGVNRLAGQRGPCHAGPEGRIFNAQIEVGDESDVCPVFAVAFSGCDLRCDFCNTGRESWDASAGSVPEGVEREALLGRIGRAWESGAVRSLMILGGEPTIHLSSALELVAALPDALPVVWKTNAHGTPESNALLDGVFDAWVADLKFGNDDCARRIARVEGYCARVHPNLQWAAGHTRLIVRHLLLPGHLDCCWRPAAAWLAEHLPQAEVSLRAGFWPGWFSDRHPELKALGRRSEAQEAMRIGLSAGLRLIE
jgi:putative pyruvate formate lyase activating enzyme